MLWTSTQIVVGLVLLILGAEALVRSAAYIARGLGLAPVVIGLTVVAFGTSAPELAISLGATLQGESEIAVGNVVGSNIANILLVLGLSAALIPLVVNSQVVRFDVPIMIGASILFLVFSLGGVIVRWQGAVLLTLLVLYVTYVVRQARRAGKETIVEFAREYGEAGQPGAPMPTRRLAARFVVLVLGLIVMVLGANLLVNGASDLARSMGVSELVIGLTVVALGTSAPELATSIVAALRGERDIAVGNAIGSNIFNLFFVMGATALVAQGGIAIPPEARQFDIPFMVAVAVFCLPIFYTRFTVRRWEGALLLIWYALYTVYLFLSATHSQWLTEYVYALLFFAAPLALSGIGISVWLQWRQTHDGLRSEAV